MEKENQKRSSSDKWVFIIGLYLLFVYLGYYISGKKYTDLKDEISFNKKSNVKAIAPKSCNFSLMNSKII